MMSAWHTPASILASMTGRRARNLRAFAFGARPCREFIRPSLAGSTACCPVFVQYLSSVCPDFVHCLSSICMQLMTPVLLSEPPQSVGSELRSFGRLSRPKTPPHHTHLQGACNSASAFAFLVNLRIHSYYISLATHCYACFSVFTFVFTRAPPRAAICSNSSMAASTWRMV